MEYITLPPILRSSDAVTCYNQITQQWSTSGGLAPALFPPAMLKQSRRLSLRGMTASCSCFSIRS